MFLVKQRGLVEHCVDLGDKVKEGQLVAKVHNIERTGNRSLLSILLELMVSTQVVIFPGHVINGDFLGIVAVPV